MMICMYGAASDRINQKYIDIVEELGKKIVERNHELIYGGGGTGLMGAVARGVYNNGGKVTGVVPHFMHDFEPIYEYTSLTIKTETMGDRKQIMEDNADAFIICPGGIGTLDEFFQILTLKELKRQIKPIVLLNIDGFFDPVVELINNYIEKGFVRELVSGLYGVANSPEEAIQYLEEHL